MNITTKNLEKGLKKFTDSILNTSKLFKNEDITLTHPWYIPSHLAYAFDAFGRSLTSAAVRLTALQPSGNVRTIRLVIKDEAPLEGFDVLFQLMFAGHLCVVHLPPAQQDLLNFFLKSVHEHLPELPGRVIATDEKLISSDGIIYCGPRLNKTMREYFESRNALLLEHLQAPFVFTGFESPLELQDIAIGMAMHFGRAINSVNTIWVPEDYNFNPLMRILDTYSAHKYHSKYFNHYEYQKAAMLINQVAHLDTGYILFCEDKHYLGKISVVVYQKYKDTMIKDEGMPKDYGHNETPYFREMDVINSYLSKG
ncbi:hypothetical protein MASR1M74_27760 [Lentimicrobium sp.]